MAFPLLCSFYIIVFHEWYGIDPDWNSNLTSSIVKDIGPVAQGRMLHKLHEVEVCLDFIVWNPLT